MIFSGKMLRLSSGWVDPWTPIPDAHDWPNKDRLIKCGDLIEVPDKYLIRSLRAKAKRGRKDELEL